MGIFLKQDTALGVSKGNKNINACINYKYNYIYINN